jgi:hypothetical protein
MQTQFDAEEKAIINAKARSEAFESGINAGRRLADEIDAAIYTRDDMHNIFEAGIYALTYMRAFMEGFERAYKRRCDANAAMRYDDRQNKLRALRKEQTQ